jgi:putative hemolysin
MLHERPWMDFAIMIARKYDLPVIPVTIRTRQRLPFFIVLT